MELLFIYWQGTLWVNGTVGKSPSKTSDNLLDINSDMNTMIHMREERRSLGRKKRVTIKQWGEGNIAGSRV